MNLDELRRLWEDRLEIACVLRPSEYHVLVVAYRTVPGGAVLYTLLRYMKLYTSADGEQHWSVSQDARDVPAYRAFRWLNNPQALAPDTDKHDPRAEDSERYWWL